MKIVLYICLGCLAFLYGEVKAQDAVEKGAALGGTNQVSNASSGENRNFKGRQRLTAEQRETLREAMEQIRKLPQDQRANELAKQPWFQQLPTEKQQRIKARLEQGVQGGGKNDPTRRKMRERWQKLTPEQKEQVRQFARKAREMTPGQRKQAFNELPFFKDASPEERQMLKERMKRFQCMSKERQEKVSKNYERWQKMTPEEREQARQRFRERQQARETDALAQ
ncbi:MAG: DUF3106 domain-containing protein [Verrucomicrobiae bacterium]|nr:DUF3106 domain-containing protein [Verrucomicrobiae bacterium]